MLRKPTMRLLWQRTVRNEGGSALVLGLVLILTMTLLGVALFDLGTIEVSLAAKSVHDTQAFYCAEAEAKRIYNLYAPYDPINNPTGDQTLGTLGPQTFAATTLNLVNGIKPDGTPFTYPYSFSGSATVNVATQLVTVRATCTLPNGGTRTVQWNGTRTFLNPGYEYAVVSAGFDPLDGIQKYLGNLYLGGTGDPVSNVLGKDTISGDVYVSGTVFLRNEVTVKPYDPSAARPTITTLNTGCGSPPCVVDNSSAFPSAGDLLPTGSSPLNPMPAISNAAGTGILDEIKNVVAPSSGPASMKGTYNGNTVYNLPYIFDQLCGGIANCPTYGGQQILANPDPANCTFGTASANEKCQIWQDLVFIRPQLTTSAHGPVDMPSYYFQGIPQTSSNHPPNWPGFPTIYNKLVNASAELKQMGFDPGSGSNMGGTNQYGDCGSLQCRLAALLGPVPDGTGQSLVDFTYGIDPATGQATLRSAPPIFYADGYWRVAGGVGTFGYNGRATVVATKSMIISDNVRNLNGLDNVSLNPPSGSTCPNNGNDRVKCGAGDMLGLVAKEDIWMGDPGASGATVHEISALMLAGRDFNTFDYTSSGSCCHGPANPITFNGTMMASREIKMVRDWSAIDPPNGAGPQAECNGAGPGGGCRPVAFFSTQPSNFTGAWCGDPSIAAQPGNARVAGCWVFLTMNTSTGVLDVDSTKAAFNDGCVTTVKSPLTPASCASGSRRVTHFQLNINYDARLTTAPSLIPPGLPAGGTTIYQGLSSATWKDCGSNPACT